MASGDTLLILTPLASEYDDDAPATHDVLNNHPLLDFCDDDFEYATWSAIMPRHYDQSGITVLIHWTHLTATEGDVDWDVAFERIGDQIQDIYYTSFAAYKSADNNTVPGTTGLVDVVSLEFSDGAEIDSIAAGELFRVRIRRDGVSDTAVGDAQLLMVELKET